MSDTPLMIRIHPDCKNKNPIVPPVRSNDVGYDLKLWIEDGELILNPQKMYNIRTGVHIKLPENMWGDIRSRSSTFIKRNLFVMNGTIDNGYVGEISVVVWNPTLEPHSVKNGDRLAQLIIMPTMVPKLVVVGALPLTDRGENGFGSSGT